MRCGCETLPVRDHAIRSEIYGAVDSSAKCNTGIEADESTSCLPRPGPYAGRGGACRAAGILVCAMVFGVFPEPLPFVTEVAGAAGNACQLIEPSPV